MLRSSSSDDVAAVLEEHVVFAHEQVKESNCLHVERDVHVTRRRERGIPDLLDDPVCPDAGKTDDKTVIGFCDVYMLREEDNGLDELAHARKGHRIVLE